MCPLNGFCGNCRTMRFKDLQHRYEAMFKAVTDMAATPRRRSFTRKQTKAYVYQYDCNVETVEALGRKGKTVANMPPGRQRPVVSLDVLRPWQSHQMEQIQIPAQAPPVVTSAFAKQRYGARVGTAADKTYAEQIAHIATLPAPPAGTRWLTLTEVQELHDKYAIPLDQQPPAGDDGDDDDDDDGGPDDDAMADDDDADDGTGAGQGSGLDDEDDEDGGGLGGGADDDDDDNNQPPGSPGSQHSTTDDDGLNDSALDRQLQAQSRDKLESASGPSRSQEAAPSASTAHRQPSVSAGKTQTDGEQSAYLQAVADAGLAVVTTVSTSAATGAPESGPTGLPVRLPRPGSPTSTLSEESEELLYFGSPVDPLLAKAFDSESSSSDISVTSSPRTSARTRGLPALTQRPSAVTSLVPYSSTGSSSTSTGRQPTGPTATRQEAAQDDSRLTIEDVLSRPSTPVTRQPPPACSSASSSDDSVIPPSPPRASGRPGASQAVTTSQVAPRQREAVTSSQQQPPTEAAGVVSTPPVGFTDALGLARKSVTVTSVQPEQVMRRPSQASATAATAGRADASAEQPIVLVEETPPLSTDEFDDDNSRSRAVDKLMRNIKGSSDSPAPSVIPESRSTPSVLAEGTLSDDAPSLSAAEKMRQRLQTLSEHTGSSAVSAVADSTSPAVLASDSDVPAVDRSERMRRRLQDLTEHSGSSAVSAVAASTSPAVLAAETPSAPSAEGEKRSVVDETPTDGAGTPAASSGAVTTRTSPSTAATSTGSESLPLYAPIRRPTDTTSGQPTDSAGKQSSTASAAATEPPSPTASAEAAAFGPDDLPVRLRVSSTEATGSDTTPSSLRTPLEKLCPSRETSGQSNITPVEAPPPGVFADQINDALLQAQAVEAAQRNFLYDDAPLSSLGDPASSLLTDEQWRGITRTPPRTDDV